MKTKWAMFRDKKYFIVSAIIFVAAGYYYISKNKNLKIPFPYTFSVANNTSFACESVMYSGIFGNSAKYLIGGIEGEVSKGTDKVAMSIKDSKTLTFITGASVGIGMTEGDNFIILQNTEERLFAVWFNDNAISNIVLNKKNGLAIWLKGSQSPFYDAPNGQIIYLICR